MRETRPLMGMPITVEIVDQTASTSDIEAVFNYFTYVDETFSTYKGTSEITKINHGLLTKEQWSHDMKEVFTLAEETKKLTGGYFDIVNRDGIYDPSGLVKGWAIQKASELLLAKGFKNFYINAGGDIQAQGRNAESEKWRVGIQDPFAKHERIVKVLYLENQGVATSGSYVRGHHIYNPYDKGNTVDDVVSLTVIGDTIYNADRFATAAFAMGKKGIAFIEQVPGLEGYSIDTKGMATMTSGFEQLTQQHA